jgi:hypothetical protein
MRALARSRGAGEDASRRGLALPLGALAAATAGLGFLLAPTRADAAPGAGDVVDGVGDAVGGVGDLVGGGGIGGAAEDLIGGGLGGIIEDGFVGILELLFDELGAELSLTVIRWLIEVPDLTGGRVGNLIETTQVMAFGMLAVVLTLAIGRYWMMSFSPGGGGGFDIAHGITRAVGAGLLIASWPALFRIVADAMNAAPRALLRSPGVRANLADLFDAITIGEFDPGGLGVGLIIPALVALIGALLLLALMMVKIILIAFTVVVVVAMPLAIVLWPIPELAWVARWLLRMLLIALAIPFIWVLIFACFAAIGADTFSAERFGDEGILQEAIVKPLVALALLYLMLAVPKRLLQVVPLVGEGSGVLSRLSSTQISRAAQPHIPAFAGGTRGSTVGRGDAGRGHSLDSGTARKAVTLVAASAGGGVAAGAGSRAGAQGVAVASAKGQGASARQLAQPADEARSTAGTQSRGLPVTETSTGKRLRIGNPDPQRAQELRQRLEHMRTNPSGRPGVEQAREGLNAQPPGMREALANTVADTGNDDTRLGARITSAAATPSTLSERQIDGLLVFGAATSQARQAALDDLGGGGGPPGPLTDGDGPGGSPHGTGRGGGPPSPSPSGAGSPPRATTRPASPGGDPQPPRQTAPTAQPRKGG